LQTFDLHFVGDSTEHSGIDKESIVS
jgi:hypothetical protein